MKPGPPAYERKAARETQEVIGVDLDRLAGYGLLAFLSSGFIDKTQIKPDRAAEGPPRWSAGCSNKKLQTGLESGFTLNIGRLDIQPGDITHLAKRTSIIIYIGDLNNLPGDDIPLHERRRRDIAEVIHFEGQPHHIRSSTRILGGYSKVKAPGFRNDGLRGDRQSTRPAGWLTSVDRGGQCFNGGQRWEMPMRLLLLEQIELVQEQAVVERAGSAGGLVEEPSLTGPTSSHRQGWPREEQHPH